MKRLLLAACLLGPAAGRAQQAPATNAVAPYRYCALVVNDRRFHSPKGIYLDYGQDAPGAVADPEMVEMAKNIRQSASVIDVLNYLSRHQWELMNVTTVQTETYKPNNSYTGYADYETRYLLRRRTP